jgi:hypothetical protein
MSYDLEIWSVRELLDGPGDVEAKWAKSAEGWALGSGRSQFLIDRSYRIEPEDMPDEVAGSLPGLQFLTRFYLEGDQSPRQVASAKSIAKRIARSIHGIVVDPQEDLLLLPSGIKRMERPERDERFTILKFTWWFFDDSPLISDSGPEALLNLIEKTLPELLPARYGLFEPLEYKLKETGRKHLLKFLTAEFRNGLIWKPAKGFSLHLGFPKPLGASWRSFRTNYIAVSVDASLLCQPGWQTQLRLFWVGMSALIQPIYGDVRALKGQPRSGWYLPNDPQLEEHPVRSWFWRGVPRKLGVAFVLGSAYQLLWPDVMRTATIKSGLAFLSTADWTAENDHNDELPPVPDGIASPPSTNQEEPNIARSELEYPTQWPFGPQFAPRKLETAGVDPV